METKHRAVSGNRAKEPAPHLAQELDLQAARQRAVFAFDCKVQDLLLELDDVTASLPDWVKRR